MRSFVVLLLLVLAAGSAPSVTAGASVRGHDVRGHELRTWDLWANVTLDGVDADGSRSEADGNGNGDGAVSATEATAYEAFVQSRTKAQLTAPQVTLDGQDPVSQDVPFVRAQGIVGPVTGGRAALFDVEIRVRFGGEAAGDRHTVARAARSTDAGPLSVTVPPGAVAIDGRGIDGFAVSSDGRTVTGTSDGAHAIEVRFRTAGSTSDTTAPAATSMASGPTHTTPGPQAYMGLVVLSLTVFARRPDRRP